MLPAFESESFTWEIRSRDPNDGRINKCIVTINNLVSAYTDIVSGMKHRGICQYSAKEKEGRGVV